MTRFLIDEDVNQKAIRAVPVQAKNFDVLYPEDGGYKGAVDGAIIKKVRTEGRVFVSRDKDFKQYGLGPEDLPDGAIWLRAQRISQRRTGELLSGLCKVLTREFTANPYDFHEKIIEVFPDRVVVHTPDNTTTFQVPP
jgi:predicted nuclease of predicted toxin-antitoxin system